MRRTSLIASLLASALLATPLAAQTNQKHPPAAAGNADASSRSEAQTFVTKAANGGLFEVESSRLAQQRAIMPEVKTFAQKMVADHTKANEELKAIAAKVGAKVPAKLDPQHQAMLTAIRNAKGNAFDRV